MLVLFSMSHFYKLLFSVATDQLERSGLIADKNDSVGVQETDNKNDNFGRSLLGRTMLNWKLFIIYNRK